MASRYKNREHRGDDHSMAFLDCPPYLFQMDMPPVYQDLFDLASDDTHRGGPRKSSLLLYIQARAFREHGIIVHTGSTVVEGEDNHFGDPADMADLCEAYDSYERETVLEFLAGIK